MAAGGSPAVNMQHAISTNDAAELVESRIGQLDEHPPRIERISDITCR